MCEAREAPQGAGTVTCTVCPRQCRLAPGALGACRARRNVSGRVVGENYGRVTTLALDPVEKKPLARFMPGAQVLSVGGYGCNLRCPFCQNHGISQSGADGVPWRAVAPAELVGMAVALREQNPQAAGIAYTYNEPLVGWEYVRDCARLAREAGLVNVLVSNGMADEGVVRELAPLMNAANIDLKSFSPAFYQGCVTGRMPTDGNGAACSKAAYNGRSNGAGKAAGVRCDANGAGDKDNATGLGNHPGAEAQSIGARALNCVKRTLELLAREAGCHLEVTTLVIPGLNDTEEEIGAMAQWLAALDYREEPNPRAACRGAETPRSTAPTYHVTRFFPRWRFADRGPTPTADVRRLASVARRYLPHVYVGNC